MYYIFTDWKAIDDGYCKEELGTVANVGYYILGILGIGSFILIILSIKLIKLTSRYLYRYIVFCIA